MSEKHNLPDPAAYAQGLTKEELLAYREIYGEDSREWVIARRELGRRIPTTFQKLRPWIAVAYLAIVVTAYFWWF